MRADPGLNCPMTTPLLFDTDPDRVGHPTVNRHRHVHFSPADQTARQPHVELIVS